MCQLSYPPSVHPLQRLRQTVQRHIWKDYEDLADDVRCTPKYQRLYKWRKVTIERVFAGAKKNTP